MRLAHHLYHHPSGIFYFRINVPSKLRPVYGQQQIRKSLNTKDPRLAKLWAYVLSSRYLAEFQQQMPTPKLEEVIKAARLADRYEVTLPNGLTIKAEDEADHARALETIGCLDQMGALTGRPQSSSSNQSVWQPAKPLHLSEGIQRHLLALKPHTLPKTYNIKRLALGEFKAWKTDTQIHTINRTDLADYCQFLITAGKAKPTISNKFIYLRQFFTAMQEGGFYPMGDNPAQGHIRYTKREKSQRRKFGFEAFSPEELKIIFSPEDLKLNKNKEHHYWVPWIALYTGARVSEICQLAIGDFFTSEGILCLRITDEGADQKLKTEGSNRIVPLHPALLDKGLGAFVEAQSAKGQIKLFPRLQNVLNGPGDAMSKAFMRYLTKLKIEAKTGKKGMHSFRKTITQKMQDHKVPAEYRAQFLGHDLDDEHFQAYSRKYTPKELAEVIFPALTRA